jgi:MFS family permease
MNKRDRARNQISLRFAARVFKHRNYRLFFGGQGLSLIGTWMQQIAMSWLVYRLTDSPFMLGFIGFSGQVPTFLLASFAGVIADRWNRRNLLYATQTVSMLQAFILAALTLSGSVNVWQIAILSTVLGIANAFDVPIRQSFVVEIVEKKEELGNAIALNSFMFNGARLVGPSLAGLLIGVFGEGICFLLNGVSFFAIIFALRAMTIPAAERRHDPVKMLEGLSEGFRYAFQFTPIFYILLLLGLISLVGMPYLVLLPVFARDILHRGPETLGFLMAAAGVGALCGALYLASRKSVLGLGRLIVIASILFGCALIAFSFSRNLALSLFLMLFTGFNMIVLTASSNTILQTIVEEDKRGRVMSFFAISFIGMTPFGSLLAGGLASRIGAPYTLTLGGIACIVGSLLFFSRLPAIRKVVRPIYEQMGIIRDFPSDL